MSAAVSAWSSAERSENTDRLPTLPERMVLTSNRMIIIKLIVRAQVAAGPGPILGGKQCEVRPLLTPVERMVSNR
jgi:uncharacterized membrane protein